MESSGTDQHISCRQTPLAVWAQEDRDQTCNSECHFTFAWSIDKAWPFAVIITIGLFERYWNSVGMSCLVNRS